MNIRKHHPRTSPALGGRLILAVAALAANLALVAEPGRADGSKDEIAVNLLGDPAGTVTPGWTVLNPFPGTESLHDVSFINADTGVAVGSNGAILTTLDGGENWTSRSSGTGQGLQAVAHLTATILVAVGDTGTILRSADAGATWSPVASGITEHLKAVSFPDAVNGFALGHGGALLRTADGGLTWTVRSTGISGAVYGGIEFADASNGWVFGDNSPAQSDLILRTTDGGETWTDQSTGEWRTVTGMHVFDDRHAMAVALDRLLETTDGGTTWTRVVAPGVWNGAGGDGGLPYLLEVIGFADADHGYIAGHGAILRTADGGKTWVNQLPATLETSFVGGIAMVDADTATVVGSNGGDILRTNDGGTTWTRQFRSAFDVPWTGVEAVDFSDAQTGTVVGTFGIARTTDGGTTWTRQASVIGDCEWLSDVRFIDAERGFAVGGNCDWQGLLLRTVDGGATWTRQVLGRPIRSIAFADAENGALVGEGGYMAITRNGGATWLARGSGTTEDFNGVAFTDSGLGVAVGRGGTVRTTADGGTTWVRVTLPTEYWLEDVSFPAPELAVAVGRGPSGQLMLRSTDRGATWSAIQLGEMGFLKAVQFGDALVGTAVGWAFPAVDEPGTASADRLTILRSTDGGQTWTPQDSGLPLSGSLMDVSFLDAEHGFAVGERGLILRTTTGGEPVSGPVPPPQLSVGFENGTLVLSWPSTFTGFVLQASAGTGLSGSWTPVTGSADQVGDRWTYAVPVNGTPGKLYRLFRP